ncbi:DUF5076 domain-containing protein [Lysobacter sp. S4-A87]|uniref:DUF5076 domain-containing protein n=1 Tax=Lysobacter sp. S4-A87 TaxID=2925843 RepID=UPI001F52CD7F|nr:DUF5076 domain-containing protein [Lysobacter sp. S4-A87]UNK50663.1 DUF5076 domain-containing protein [Lysobacter sp. S4-A87]
MEEGRKITAAGKVLGAEALATPPGVEADPAAFEILRLWVANGRLSMNLRPDVEGEAEDFGVLLADLFSHACWKYSRRSGRSLMECREGMLLGFLQHTHARIRCGGVSEH